MFPIKSPSPWVLRTAVVLTALIIGVAFWLSFTALTELAVMAGIPPVQAWGFPIIVDGMIIAGTVATVALAHHPKRVRYYGWAVLVGGAAVSVVANAYHAVLTPARAPGMPVVGASLIGAFAPVAMLVMTHLVVLLTRQTVPNVVARNQAPKTVAESGGGRGGLRLVNAVPTSDRVVSDWVETQRNLGVQERELGRLMVEHGLAGSYSTARRTLKRLNLVAS